MNLFNDREGLFKDQTTDSQPQIPPRAGESCSKSSIPKLNLDYDSRSVRLDNLRNIRKLQKVEKNNSNFIITTNVNFSIVNDKEIQKAIATFNLFEIKTLYSDDISFTLEYTLKLNNIVKNT